MRTAIIPSFAESRPSMRYCRQWYILSFLVNLAVIYSASHLISVIGDNTMEESMFPLPNWIFYATIAVSSPSALAVSRLLPDPSLALLSGGLLTSAGLLWTGLATGSVQMLSFGVIAGLGISISLQAICICLSPYFIRENATVPIVMLSLSAVVMMVHPVIKYVTLTSTHVFLYIVPLILVSSIIPALGHLYYSYNNPKSNKDEACNEYLDTDILPENDIPDKEDADNNNGCYSYLPLNLKTIFTDEGWGSSLISVLFWLSWGTGVSTTWLYLLSLPGVDTTWLSMGWHFHYFSNSTGLTALHILLCFILLFVKMATEISEPALSPFKTNLASNYMQLGVLGIAGVILCLFPEYSQAFNNHLLFTVGFALQYDDLSDLYRVRSNFSHSVHHYKLIKYRIGMDHKHDGKMHHPLWCLACLICHIVSLLLMSILAMILGIQVANVLAILSSFPPLSILCTRPGLLLISVAAVCTSLVKPDSWMGKKRRILVM